MGGIGLLIRQQVIQAMLRIFRQRVRKFNTQAAKSRGSNSHQQSRDRLSSFTQIYDSLINQISAG